MTIPTVAERVPVLGSLPLLWRDPARGLVRMYEQYGPVFRAKVVGNFTFAIGPEANGTVLKSRADAFGVGGRSATLLALFGEHALIFLDGAPHRKIRAAMHGPLRGPGLASVAPIIAEEVRRAVASWERVRILHATRMLTISSILRAGVGVHDPAEVPRLEHLFDRLMMASSALFRYPGSPYARGLRAKREIDDWTRARIAQLRADRSAAGGDVLSLLLTAGEGDAALTDDEILDNIRMLVTAGYETTSTILAWAIIELARDPDLWDAICAEVGRDTVLPGSMQELRAFPLVEALLNETLRRYTPLWVLARKVVADDVTVCGHAFPRGSRISISPIATNHLSEHWPDPFRFDVGRWRGRAVPPVDAFLPWGGGSHVCLGAAFAMVELTQAIVTLAAGRRRPVLDGRYDLRPYTVPLVHPSEDIRVRFVAG
jgi:cytochrome P450